MREILFRGKRIDNGEWVEGYLIHDEFCNTQIPYIGYLCGDSVDVAEVDPETVGQYTGLRDCTRTKEYPNGKRIFEGDILQYINPRNGKSGRCGAIESAVWNCGCCYSVFGFAANGCVDIGDHEKCIVVGNIYDNLELLEENHE